MTLYYHKLKQRCHFTVTHHFSGYVYPGHVSRYSVGKRSQCQMYLEDTGPAPPGVSTTICYTDLLSHHLRQHYLMPSTIPSKYFVSLLCKNRTDTAVYKTHTWVHEILLCNKKSNYRYIQQIGWILRL